MFKYDNRVKIPAGSELKINDYFENLEKYNNNYRYRPNYENLIEFKSNKKEFLKMLIDENKDQNLDFLKKISNKENRKESEYDYSKDNTSNNYNKSKSNIMKKPTNINKVLIFPSFQFFNINQFDDQEILKNLISKDYFSKIRLSSGYLNLSDFIINTFKSKDYEVEIVTSSPKANSFYKAGFIKKNIPYFYRIYEQGILQNMKNKANFSLFEFHRENWSFHSKGLWFYEKEKQNPSMTVIGSSNYSNYIFI